MLTPILGMDTDRLRALAEDEGESAYRGNQIAQWVYLRHARALADMSNLPQALRASLSQKYDVGRSQIVASQQSADGTVKLLLALADGARVETVGLPYEDRCSCCLSTQVGCRMGCVFCATGRSGYTRDLTAGEMVDQVLTVQEAVAEHTLPGTSHIPRVDHVTFMGMGEPLLNYDATVRALRLLNREVGISARNLTVSTIGFVPGIARLAQEGLPITLAVSLHAATDDLRRKLVPGAAKWTVSEIIEACHQYVLQTGRRVTFEYCLLDGINNMESEAHALVKLLRGLNCHVNLIPHNPVSGLAFRASPPERTRAFYEILDRAGIQVTQRVQRGADIDAACGQLRRRNAETVLNGSTRSF